MRRARWYEKWKLSLGNVYTKITDSKWHMLCTCSGWFTYVTFISLPSCSLWMLFYREGSVAGVAEVKRGLVCMLVGFDIQNEQKLSRAGRPFPVPAWEWSPQNESARLTDERAYRYDSIGERVRMILEIIDFTCPILINSATIGTSNFLCTSATFRADIGYPPNLIPKCVILFKRFYRKHRKYKKLR